MLELVRGTGTHRRYACHNSGAEGIACSLSAAADTSVLCAPLPPDPLFKTVIKSGPSSRSAAPAAVPVATPAAPAAPASRPDPRAIWSPAEVLALRELEPDASYDLADGRVKPDYDILYAQSLSAEDVFMGLSAKDGSTQSCEALTVKISMPGEAFRNVSLDVTPTRLLVRSVKYKLFLHLPHTVDDRAGRAKWDERKETLSVTLPIVKKDEDDEDQQ